MIKNLRRRFILTSMVAVVIVISIMMVVINIVNYTQIVNSADNVLELLEENGGFFPQREMKPPPNMTMTAETPYESRFFTVFINNSGEVAMINTGSIAAVGSKDAVEMATTILDSGKISGFSGVYRYSVSSSQLGSMVIFLDRSRELDSLNNTLITSLGVAVCAIVGIFFLVLIFSKRAVRPIAESYARQKRFITDASHELKTPLAVINASTEVLELTSGENEWTKSIHNQVERLASLTEGMVALTRLDEESNKLMMTEFSMSDAVAESVEPFVALASQEGKTITADIQQGLSYSGNEDSIRKLLGILIDNAIKYSTPNSEIGVTMKASGKSVLLQVKNQAQSTEKGPHDEMFERFYRADSSRSDIKGYGIGLSIAREICRVHKGQISARSDDGVSLIITASL